VNSLDRLFWAVFLSIAMLGTTTWLAIFEHNYHPRIYRYNGEVTTIRAGDSELDFNHPPGGVQHLVARDFTRNHRPPSGSRDETQ